MGLVYAITEKAKVKLISGRVKVKRRVLDSWYKMVEVEVMALEIRPVISSSK